MKNAMWRLEDYFDLKMIDEISISPINSWVAIEIRSAPKEANSFVSSLVILDQDGAVVRRIEHATRPRWSPIDSQLCYLDVSSGAAVPTLVSAGQEPACVGGPTLSVEAAEWSSDGLGIFAIVATPSEKDPLFIDSARYRYDGMSRDRHVTPRRLDYISVKDGSARKLLGGDFDVLAMAAGPNGTFAAAIKRVVATELDHYVDILHGSLQENSAIVQVSGDLRFVDQLRLSPEGTKLAYLRQHGADFGTSLCVEVVDLFTHAAEIVLEDAQGMHGMRSSLHWLAEDRLLASQQRRGGHAIFDIPLLDPSQARIALEGDTQLSAIAVADGLQVWLAVWWIGVLPRVVSVDLKEPNAGVDGLVSRYDPNIDLRGARSPHHATRLTLDAGGTSFESFVVEPEVANGETIISIHGGPHLMHPTADHRVWFETQLLAAEGYRVVLPNPVGSAGYGLDFALATQGGNWGKADAMQFLALFERYSLSDTGPSGVHLIGYSYGGYMGLLLGTRNERFSSIVSGGCVSNLISLFGTSDVPGFVKVEMGGTPESAIQNYLDASPIMHASKLKSPTLFLHQSGDLRCPLAQAEEMFVAIRSHGVESAIQVFEGGAHTIASPAQFNDRLAKTLSWVKNHGLARA